MKDLNLFAHESYLDEIERSAAREHRRPYRKPSGEDLGLQVRAMAVLAVVVVVALFNPWIG